MKRIKLVLLFFCIAFVQLSFSQSKLKIVIAGLSHDHVNGMLAKANDGEVIIIGIAEPDQQLCERMKAAYELPDSVFYKNLAGALKKNQPDLVMVYNSPVEHLAAVATALPLRIPVMVEKPLCFSYADAVKMKKLSDQYKTKVFVNYPSIWYTSFMELVKRVNEKNEVGTVQKMIMHGGHRGPVEIGCSKDFLYWLTNPHKNGGGALTDFGCYGASMMTELMNGAAPLSVYATARQVKPTIYPAVDDDATIILQYPTATGITQASWNWPYTIMDVEVYGKDAYLHAAEINGADPVTLQSKNGNKTKAEEISEPQYKDEVAYLTAVIKNHAPDDNTLMSLERNLVVVQILDAARRSVKEGKKIVLQKGK